MYRDIHLTHERIFDHIKPWEMNSCITSVYCVSGPYYETIICKLEGNICMNTCLSHAHRDSDNYLIV